MAFLSPHFAYDIFVSYSHGDPRGLGDSPLKSWTTTLINELKHDIQAIETEFDDLDIWYDEHIDPTAHLTPELYGKVKKSGILIVVMSPRYLGSDWCRDEGKWFREQVRERKNDINRIFVIRAVRTKPEDWPEFLRDERGHQIPGIYFYDREGHSDGMPFGWRGTHKENRQYSDSLWRLSLALKKKLRDLERHYLAAPTPNPISAIGHAMNRIYLYGRSEYISLRDKIRNQLLEDGLTPFCPTPDVGIGLVDWTQEGNTRVHEAKHFSAMALVRADTSDRFIGDVLEIGIDERQRIQSARGSPLPCAILDGSGENLPFDLSRHGIRRFDLNAEGWRTEFHAWLESMKPPGSVAI